MARTVHSEAELKEAGKKARSSPIYWFTRLLMALDDGDHHTEYEARRALEGLGWMVTRRSGQPPSGGDAGEASEDRPRTRGARSPRRRSTTASG